MQQQEKELFQSYEIKNWIFTPRLYKIFGAAAILNILTIFVLAQADVFTTRGCDSPLVGNFCQVLDTVYLGSVILGTEHDYVDKDYVKTELADAEITFVDVSSAAPPFTYPSGYPFANPASNEFTAVNNFDIPNFPGIPSSNMNGFPPNSTFGGNNDLLSKPQVVATPNPKAITGKLPDSPFKFDVNPTNVNPVPPPGKNSYSKPKRNPNFGKPKYTSPKALPPLPGEMTAENKPNPVPSPNPTATPEAIKSDAPTEVDINKRPIKDLGVFVNSLLNDQKNKFSLETEFTAEAKGKLTKEGKLDPKTYKITATSADPKMVEVVQQSIEAINDAGYLQYLKDLSGKDLNLLLKQDGAGITAVVQSEVESNNRANTLKGLLNLAISIAKSKKTDPNDKDDLALLNGATVESDGKKLIIKFTIPNPQAQEMIKRKLLEQAEKDKTNSTAQNTNKSQATAK